MLSKTEFLRVTAPKIYDSNLRKGSQSWDFLTFFKKSYRNSL